MAERFVHAYLRADPSALGFIPHRFDDAEDRAKVCAQAAQRSVSPAVQAILRAQNAALAPSAARDAHLEALAQPGTLCVVTGQQVGLFLGPLYTVYKAAAAIVTARALAAQTGRPVVPIFWLQTEDHDFEELATAWLPRGEAPLALTAADDGQARVSVARRQIGEDIETLRARLEAELQGLPELSDTLERLARHYRPGRTWPQAFAGMLAELFVPEGLVLFDPRDPAVAPLAAAVHRRAITRASPIFEAMQARSEDLNHSGFTAPVHLRPGAPLSFYHPDGPEGPRFRLVPQDGQWSLVGRDELIPRADLEAALEHAPQSFSTSALLRPILQDTLLPTAAYVGGPGEIDYFAQLGPLYEAFGLPMPLLVPRARFVLVEGRQQRALQNLGLTSSDLARPLDELLHQTASPGLKEAPQALRARLLHAFEATLAELHPELERLQPGLQKAAERTQETVQRACDKFIDKYDSALQQADQQRVQTLERLKAALFPAEQPQERLVCLPYFGARYGDRAFIDKVLQRCRPYHPDLEDLQA